MGPKAGTPSRSSPSRHSRPELAGEVIAEQFSRWSGIPFVALRISNITEEWGYESRFPEFWDDPKIRAWNLWGNVDVRDVAQAARISLTADVSGAEPFIVAASDTCMTRDSPDLMAGVYADVPIHGNAEGCQSLLSIDKARDTLGYEPEHQWRDYVEEPTSGSGVRGP